MKGTIRQNLGASRYVVGVRSAVQPLADEIEKYQKLYQATIPKITDAYGVLNERRGAYQAALDAVRVVAADYELCRLAFSSTTCIDSGNAACENAYAEADSACLDIESGVGECDPDCQRERERCHDAAVRVRTACLAQVAIDCAEAEYAHVLECQTTYSPLIAQAQAAALALLPGMQEALYNLHHEQAIQWQLARKLNELEGIDNREYQITCFSAQWDEELAVGSEVEMARTPNGRNAITRLITAPTPCLHDARVLPSGHLFVNASLAPGFETWRPTWRVGTVLEVIPPNLRVQFAPANIAGSLGTLYSENPLDCTPPQCYFDGKDPKEAEADIRAARTALTAAQQALVDAVALRADCLAEFDQAWMDQCYGAAVELCDAAFGDAMEQPTLDKGACYDDAQGTCEEQTTAGLEACALTYQPAIDDAQGEVDAATAVLDQATSDLTGAQNALAAIEAEIQACVDAVNTQAWLDDERDRLTGLCAEAADDRKQECLDNGNTAAECQLVRDAIYADCVALIDEQLPLRQAAARDKCQADRQADVDAAEGEIDAAYTAVNNAEIALRQVIGALEIAEKALADCLDQWVLGDCLASALQICDDTYELAEDTYTQRRAACYQEAMAECDRQRDEAIDACYAAHADAIAAAQTAVDEAARAVELATNGRYHPADPLILEVPIAHCRPESYAENDEVLIDFPVAEGVPIEAMTYWDARRVIGWASNTKQCAIQTFVINYFINYQQCYVSGDLEQEVDEGEDGTPVVVQHVFNYESSYLKQMTNAQLQFILVWSYHLYDILFYRWSDGWEGLSHTATDVAISSGFYSFIWETPQKIYFKPVLEQDYSDFTDTIRLQPYERCYPTGQTLPWFEITGIPTTTDADSNPYNENDYTTLKGWGNWRIAGENGLPELVIAKIPWPDGWQDDEDGWDVPGWDDSGKTFGAYDDAPGTIVLWAPLFRIGHFNTPAGTFPGCVFSKTGTITDVYNQIYHEYSRTSFGGSVYDYI
ncbi:MAG: hypothetical protein KAY97_00095 [Chromatiaceae bacterium]|nr:hypothetical protein [Chromatiaceae bacterium]